MKMASFEIVTVVGVVLCIYRGNLTLETHETWQADVIIQDEYPQIHALSRPSGRKVTKLLVDIVVQEWIHS